MLLFNTYRFQEAGTSFRKANILGIFIRTNTRSVVRRDAPCDHTRPSAHNDMYT